MNSKTYIKKYCKNVIDGFVKLEQATSQIEQVANAIRETINNGNKILLCGNGGSAADAQHIAAELIGRYLKERKALPAIALTTDTSVLTAIANDYDFSQVFKRQIQGLGKDGDLLQAISTSGNSKNILEAAIAAKLLGMKVIGLTGQSGQALAELCDHCIQVPSNETSHIQEMHIAVSHMICGLTERPFA